MVTPVTTYKTSDGKTFQDEVAAEAHEAGLKHAAVITEFLDRHYPVPAKGKSGPARSIAGKAIAAWLAEQDED